MCRGPRAPLEVDRRVAERTRRASDAARVERRAELRLPMRRSAFPCPPPPADRLDHERVADASRPNARHRLRATSPRRHGARHDRHAGRDQPPARDAVLLPIASMTSGGGPMNVTPASTQAARRPRSRRGIRSPDGRGPRRSGAPRRGSGRPRGSFSARGSRPEAVRLHRRTGRGAPSGRSRSRRRRCGSPSPGTRGRSGSRSRRGWRRGLSAQSFASGGRLNVGFLRAECSRASSAEACRACSPRRRSAAMSFARVSAGSMISSTKPRERRDVGIRELLDGTRRSSPPSPPPVPAELALVEDRDCALGPHDRDLRRRVREVEVRAEVLGRHHAVRAAVRLPGDDRDLRNGRLREREEELRAVPDDAAVLLLRAREGTRARPRRRGAGC